MYIPACGGCVRRYIKRYTYVAQVELKAIELEAQKKLKAEEAEHQDALNEVMTWTRVVQCGFGSLHTCQGL